MTEQHSIPESTPQDLTPRDESPRKDSPVVEFPRVPPPPPPTAPLRRRLRVGMKGLPCGIICAE